jgi:hypothetical protein
VGPAGGVLPNLRKGHDVETEVELAVAGAREPMAENISGRYVDRGGAGVGGERGRGAEPIDRADPAEDLASRQRADTDPVGQSGAGVVNRGLDVSGCLGDAAVQLTYLSDQVGGKATNPPSRKSRPAVTNPRISD